LDSYDPPFDESPYSASQTCSGSIITVEEKSGPPPCTTSASNSGSYTSTVVFNNGDTYICTFTATTVTGDCGFATCGGPETTTVNYSGLVEPETTEALIARVLTLLPSYDNDWNDTAGSFRNLSTDESSYSIRRGKWRLKHAPSGTCYLKVWLQRRFAPEGGGSPTLTPITAYEWTGTGNPCLADAEKSVSDPDNQIVSSATEEMEPGTDGTVTIEIVKYSCVPGYTPPDDGSANGYPVPA
jgi:hypothetical protein